MGWKRGVGRRGFGALTVRARMSAALVVALVGGLAVLASIGPRAAAQAVTPGAGPRPVTASVAAGGIKFKATGYFSIGQQDGRSWLVTPTGQPFYSAGIDHVSSDPDTDQVTGQCPYCETIAAEYPSTSAWATATVARLRSWGFNSLGPFTGDCTFASRMPYSVQLSMASGEDWFASSFVTNADEVAATQVAPLADDPNLIGYYTDSELNWGPDGSDSKTELADYLALPAGSPGLAVAKKYVGNPNGFVYALATRYFSSHYGSRPQVRHPPPDPGGQSRGAGDPAPTARSGKTLRRCLQHRRLHTETRTRPGHRQGLAPVPPGYLHLLQLRVVREAADHGRGVFVHRQRAADAGHGSRRLCGVCHPEGSVRPPIRTTSHPSMRTLRGWSVTNGSSTSTNPRVAGSTERTTTSGSWTSKTSRTRIW